MSHVQLLRRVHEVAARQRLLSRLRGTALAWGLLGIAVGLLLAFAGTELWAYWVFVAGFPLIVVGGVLIWRQRLGDSAKATELIEQAHPALDSRLRTALGMKPEAGQWGYSYLQQQVLEETERMAHTQNWRETIPSWSLWKARILQIAACAVCLAFGLQALEVTRSHRQLEQLAASLPQDTTNSNPTEEFQLTVEPGDAELEQGTSLLVLARFAGKLPEQVDLIATSASGESTRLPLRKSLDDPLFGGRIPDVQTDLTYRIEYSGGKSDEYQVTTYVLPELLQADAELDYPEYTGKESERIQDVRRLSVVEGTSLAWECQINKPVESAVLVGDDGQEYPLELTSSENPSAAPTMKVTWPATGTERHKFTLKLTDADGRTNREPPQFQVEVLPNRPADLKVTFPARDVRISPLQELALQAKASDDFGLAEYGVQYQPPSGDEQTVALNGESHAKQAELSHLLSLEQLELAPNDLISYVFYADDIGPDGQRRRTFSDLFFAEVREFEEIFRQAASSAADQQQQQQQQPGQPQSESEQLLEAQRQIVIATWNLIRREKVVTPSPQFLPDLQTIREAQEGLIEQATARAEEVEDVIMKRAAQAAARAMEQAVAEYQRVAQQQIPAELKAPHKHAQQAYRELLKLTSREKQVQNSQQQSQSSQSGAQRQMQQQLDQLELKNDRNRYETERQAQEQQDQADQQTLQVLNRLRELARRQEDLNEKIKELEQQLRQAQTAEEQAELQRQLKRLQEEQEQMLRDVDELREQMQRPENQEQMAEAREQVDQTRERVLQASEALQEGQTSRALSEGTRAERQLNELKEEFRRQSAGQFDERVRELRDDVNQLAEQQTELSQQMRGEEAEQEPQPGRQAPSLRDDKAEANRTEVADALQGQQTELKEVLDEMKSLVEDAEQTEPLLSSRLYDTMRELREFEPEESLEMASRLQRHGYDKEAQELEQQAREGIEQLQEGVQAAANSVLGDETAALKLAQAELNQLTEAIQQELAQAGEQPAENGTPAGTQPQQPGAEKPPEGTPPQPNGQSPAGQQPGQTPQPMNEPQPNGQSQTGSSPMPPQPGQNQPGQTPPGETQLMPNGNQPGQSPANQPMPNGSPMPGQQPMPGSTPGQGEQSGQPMPMGQTPGSPSPMGQQPQQGGAQQGGGSSHSGAAQDVQSVLQTLSQGTEGGGTSRGTERPLTGGEFREWSDRMRGLEEMLQDEELQARAAAIRDNARQQRIDIQRHSEQPNWELIRTKVYGPMVELQQLIAEDIARRERSDKLVPIDRDPVPDRYSDLVKRYYEELSRRDPK